MLSMVKWQSRREEKDMQHRKPTSRWKKDQLAWNCRPLSLSRLNFTSCELWKWQSWQGRQNIVI